MLYFCPFRALIVIVIIIIPRCRFAHHWAMYALHLPFQGVNCYCCNYSGLKAQCLSIAQGKRSGTLGK